MILKFQIIWIKSLDSFLGHLMIRSLKFPFIALGLQDKLVPLKYVRTNGTLSMKVKITSMFCPQGQGR